MRYLIVNHIAAGRGRDSAHLRLPTRWARDLAATARACAAAGVAMVVATPVTARLTDPAVEVTPDAAGFEHVELPGYTSARSFLAVRESLATALHNAIGAADVVQLDHGGYPIPLGLVADPIARTHGKRRLWTIGGDRLPDPRLAHTARTTTRRLVGRSVDARVRSQWSDALHSADAIVTHDAAVTRELHRTLGIGSTPIPTIDALDSDLATPGVLAIRRNRLADASRPLRAAIVGEQTIARGTEHVLRALQRCRRLGVSIELFIVGTGTEVSALAKLVGELNLGAAVRFTDEVALADEADVWVDAALTDAAQLDAARALAAGQAPIAYASRLACDGVTSVVRGDIDALTAALFDAAMRRDALIGRMLRGVAWARERTLDVAHRRRIELALRIARSGKRDAA